METIRREGGPHGNREATPGPEQRWRPAVRLVVRDVRSVRLRGSAGMTTAEYAVGTVAACGFGGVLYKVLTSPEVARMIRDLVDRALSVAF